MSTWGKMLSGQSSSSFKILYVQLESKGFGHEQKPGSAKLLATTLATVRKRIFEHVGFGVLSGAPTFFEEWLILGRPYERWRRTRIDDCLRGTFWSHFQQTSRLRQVCTVWPQSSAEDILWDLGFFLARRERSEGKWFTFCDAKLVDSSSAPLPVAHVLFNFVQRRKPWEFDSHQNDHFSTRREKQKVAIYNHGCIAQLRHANYKAMG